MNCKVCYNRCICEPCKDGRPGIAGLQGPKGETGPIGEQGETGPQGEPGEIGPPGPDGLDGAQGASGPQGPQGIDGPTGPQGPEGPQGIQGPAGNDGADGTDGNAGAFFCGPFHIERTGPCNYSEIAGIQVPCEVLALNPTTCQTFIFQKKVGNGFQLTVLSNPGPENVIGDTVTFVGTEGCAEWRIGGPNGTQIEMSAFNSSINNITTAGPSLSSPFFGSGNQTVQFPAANAGDVVELLYVGDNRWVIIKAILASGQLPVFT